ncbi:MAG: Ig-like domain-containing protein, partial [Gammaproteobacteria bacterium]
GSRVLYIPNTGFTGTDTFTYVVSDGDLAAHEAHGHNHEGAFASATVVITVIEAPVGNEFRLKKAEWKDEDSRLRVDGDRARTGAQVTVFNAGTGVPLGTTVVDDEGKWRFRQFNPEPVPCRVRVEIDGRSAERDVEDAPRSCNSDQTSSGALNGVEVEAEWEADDSRLEVKGEKFLRGAVVQLYNADSGDRIGEARNRREGKWRFNATLDARAAPCRLRVELGGKSMIVRVSGVRGCR